MNPQMHAQATAGQAYSQSFVCRLERLDVTVRQAKEASQILRKWLEEADHKYCFLNAGGKLVPLCYSKNVATHAKGHVRYVRVTEMCNFLTFMNLHGFPERGCRINAMKMLISEDKSAPYSRPRP